MAFATKNQQTAQRTAPRGGAFNTTVAGQTAMQPVQSTEPISFEVGGEKIELSIDIIKSYLVSGDPAKVTDQECMMFLNLCKYNGLNPWLKEAYLIKFKDYPATLVTGKEAFMKRAERNPAYDGCECGVVVIADGRLEYREGSAAYSELGETIIGGWAKVYRKDRKYPIYAEVNLSEYLGRKNDGEVNGQWSGKPGTMIRKVALVQALREAFPADLGAMYSAEEMGVQEPVAEVNYQELPRRPRKAAIPPAPPVEIVPMDDVEGDDPLDPPVSEG